MNKENFFDACITCPEEGTRVISLFSAILSVENRLILIEDAYSLGFKLSILTNGATKESLELLKSKLLKTFLYSLLQLNREYKKQTDKYLFGKIKITEETALMFYEAVSNF